MPARTTIGLALLAVVALGCGEQSVPQELQNVWRTRRTGYEDRYLEIRPDFVIFGTGGRSSMSHRITDVDVESEGKGFLCVIRYEGRDGGEPQLRLVFRPGSPDKLLFENRNEAWVREADAKWLAKGA